MARERVSLFAEDGAPNDYGEGYVMAVADSLQEDDSLWVYLRVRPAGKTKTTGKDFRDVTWSFASKGEGPRTWYQTKTSFWPEDNVTEKGEMLARLFAPPEGTNSLTGKPFDSANTRVIFTLDDVYGEIDDRDSNKVWWKLDAKSSNVWVHAPLYRDMSEGQRALWKEQYGSTDGWIDLYTLKAVDPKAAQEKLAQPEPVAAAVVTNAGGEPVMTSEDW